MSIELRLFGARVPTDLRPVRVPCAPAPGALIAVAQHVTRDGRDVIVKVGGVVDRVEWHFPHDAPPYLIAYLCPHTVTVTEGA